MRCACMFSCSRHTPQFASRSANPLFPFTVVYIITSQLSAWQFPSTCNINRSSPYSAKRLHSQRLLAHWIVSVKLTFLCCSKYRKIENDNWLRKQCKYFSAMNMQHITYSTCLTNECYLLCESATVPYRIDSIAGLVKLFATIFFFFCFFSHVISNGPIDLVLRLVFYWKINGTNLFTYTNFHCARVGMHVSESDNLITFSIKDCICWSYRKSNFFRYLRFLTHANTNQL